MHRCENVVEKRTVGRTGGVVLPAHSAHTCYLEGVLVEQHVIDLLRVGRSAGGNGHIDRLIIGDAHIHHAAVGYSRSAAASVGMPGEDRVGGHVEATAIAADAGDLRRALI